ncbi:hypothetical protein M436DRAFT_60254 [Aureobasidium namibiae CBS 147.97]|uniref:Uncharacterized protein n=1 Tax=Aureobasidium namibiae CBS 147.97 TaxID=1043004 RepID=A0A074WT89_9PEZI
MSKSPQQDIYNQLAAKDTNPEPLKKVLAREQADYDCLSCRVMERYRSNGIWHSRRIYLLVRAPRTPYSGAGDSEIALKTHNVGEEIWDYWVERGVGRVGSV